MTRIAVYVLLAGALFMFGVSLYHSESAAARSEGASQLAYEEIELSDGRVVVCVFRRSGHGGPSCRW